MDDKNSLKNGELEELASEDSFLRELASFFAHKQMRALNEVPRVITIYSLRDNYGHILRGFKDYLDLELSIEFRNGEKEALPRVVISKDAESNTYAIPVDFFLERRKMPGLPLSLNSRCVEEPVYYTITPIN